MPRLISPPREAIPPEPPPNRRKFTRKECDFLVDNNLLVGRYELIDGDIISKMGQKPPHAIVVTVITDWAVRIFGGMFVRCQLPIDVVTEDREINEPEPDVVALRIPAVEFMSSHAGPNDVLLIVEIADTSLRFDQGTKAALYARSSFPEYWVVDIVGRRIFVYRDPSIQGYQNIIEHSEDELISPLSHEDVSVRVSKLLPPIEA